MHLYFADFGSAEDERFRGVAGSSEIAPAFHPAIHPPQRFVIATKTGMMAPSSLCTIPAIHFSGDFARVGDGFCQSTDLA